MSALKLYVVGESSPDPEEWSEWGRRVLVIAASPEEAIRLAGDLAREVATEIPFDRPMVVSTYDAGQGG